MAEMKLIFEAPQGVVPASYEKVSRWVSPKEAEVWQRHYNSIPRDIGAGTVYLTAPGSPRAGTSGVDAHRIDFYLPTAALNKTKDTWTVVYLVGREFPIYNVQIFAPPNKPIIGRRH